MQKPQKQVFVMPSYNNLADYIIYNYQTLFNISRRNDFLLNYVLSEPEISSQLINHLKEKMAIETNHEFPGSTRIIIHHFSKSDASCLNPDGINESIESMFRKYHNRALIYPNIPCACVVNQFPRSIPGKYVYYPIECLNIKPQIMGTEL